MIDHNTSLIFVHGWGYGKNFWNSLQKHLSKSIDSNRFVTLDLGLINKEKILHESKKNGIYITHSMGTLWALHNRHDDIRTLISISGFTHFPDFTNTRILTAMTKRLKRTPEQQMQDFWMQCGHTPDVETLNISNLEQGLKDLTHLDKRESINNMPAHTYIMATRDDEITPYETMKEHWTGHTVDVINENHHAAPVLNPEKFANQILKFLSEHGGV